MKAVRVTEGLQKSTSKDPEKGGPKPEGHPPAQSPKELQEGLADMAKDLCQCTHARARHNPLSGSVNHTEGKCYVEGCLCRHFSMPPPDKIREIDRIELKEVSATEDGHGIGGAVLKEKGNEGDICECGHKRFEHGSYTNNCWEKKCECKTFISRKGRAAEENEKIKEKFVPVGEFEQETDGYVAVPSWMAMRMVGLALDVQEFDGGSEEWKRIDASFVFRLNMEAKYRATKEAVERVKELDRRHGTMKPADDGMEAERGFLRALAVAYSLWLRLPPQHPDEQRGMADVMHAAQDLVAVRFARRAFPGDWPVVKPPPPVRDDNRDDGK